uniref:BAR domain-containing protein n=1 Tax=Angiostrongylus cantonensis TaxID=6313 RepID=A0A0K0CWG6_ANGCA
LMELSQKFANFKHPRAFEEKLERTFHKLGDIEISLDDMTGLSLGIEAVFCSETLDDAKRLVKKLISIEEDVHSLEKGKEQLIQEGIFNKDSAFPFTEKIRLCKKKTKELGMRAEDTVERLEDCVETYGKLLQESEAVEIFLDGLDARLEKYATEDKVRDHFLVIQLFSFQFPFQFYFLSTFLLLPEIFFSTKAKNFYKSLLLLFTIFF